MIIVDCCFNEIAVRKPPSEPVGLIQGMHYLKNCTRSCNAITETIVHLELSNTQPLTI
jgi:hypothetical protein